MRTQPAWGWLAGLTVYSIFTMAYGPKLPRCEQRRQFLEFLPERCDSPLHLKRSHRFGLRPQQMFKVSDTIRRTQTVDGGILLDIHHGQMFCLNIFRRFRITHLEKSDCPEALKHFWSGHAPAHISERYVKLLNDRAYRLDWAERVGTGFVLPVGQPGLLHVVRKTV